jgi:hypothetical protein
LLARKKSAGIQAVDALADITMRYLKGGSGKSRPPGDTTTKVFEVLTACQIPYRSRHQICRARSDTSQVRDFSWL